VSDKVVENMFSAKTTTTQKTIIEPIPQPAPEPELEPEIALVPEPIKEPPPPPAAVSETKTETVKTEPEPKPEPTEKIESKYRSMQKGISLEMGGAFVPYSYYNESDSDYGSGFSMGGSVYMRIDLIYVEIVPADVVFIDPDLYFGTCGMSVILLKYPIVYKEIIKVSPILGLGGLGFPLHMGGGPYIFGGKIDVGISEIAYLRSEYLYSGGVLFGGLVEEGWGASFKIGGGFDIGLGERKKTYLRTELLYNWLGAYQSLGNGDEEMTTIHYVDLRLGIGYKW
jgi:hypothetical protein